MGNIVNSNTQFLAEKCASLGLDMYYQVTVGDNYDRMMAVVKTALDAFRYRHPHRRTWTYRR